jgi:uncharacterized protein (TIRG00374 family)
MAWAVRGIHLAEIGAVLGRLGIAQVGILLVLNLVVLWSFSWRWWAVLRALGHSIPTQSLMVYRMAAFAISYLTPGSQFGGEPLQVYLVSRRRGLPTSTAIASVVLDKTLELVANFTFLIVGVVVVLRLKLIPIAVRAPLFVLAVVLLSLPVSYLVLTCRGHRPISWIFGRLHAAWLWTGLSRLGEAVKDAEDQVGNLCRERSPWLLSAITLSGISWLIALTEAWAAMQFLGIPVGPAEAIGVVAAARLAFLLPFPGGLGALEASQVLAVTALGFTQADGIGLGLLIRARDLLVAGFGAWLVVTLAPERRTLGAPQSGTDRP